MILNWTYIFQCIEWMFIMEDILLQEFYVSYGGPFHSLSLHCPQFPKHFFSPWSTGEYLCYVRMTTNPPAIPTTTARGSAVPNPGAARPGATCVKMADQSTTSSSPKSPATLIIYSSVDRNLTFVFSYHNYFVIQFMLQIVLPFKLYANNKNCI